MTVTAANTELYRRAIDRIERQVEELNEALGYERTGDISHDYSRRVTFGYLGNVYPNGDDDRFHYVFLPHPGRPGRYEDRLGGFATGDVTGACALVSALAGAITVARHIRSH